MELTRDERWHKESLLKLARGTFLLYQEIIDSFQNNTNDSLLEAINQLNKLCMIEKYYYHFILKKTEQQHLLQHFKKIKKNLSTKDDIEAVITKEQNTLQIRRIINKLEQLQERKEMKIPLQSALEQETEIAFLTFLEEDSKRQDLKKEIRTTLQKNRFYYIYLSNFEDNYMNNLFQGNLKGQIPDCVGQLKHLYPVFEKDLSERQKEYGQKMANQQIDCLLSHSDLSFDQERQAEMLQHQELLRASFLFLETEDLEEKLMDFNTLKLRRDFTSKTHACTLVEEAFDKSANDQKKIFHQDNPQLTK